MLEGLPVPAMHREIREPNLDRDRRWDIHGRVEVRGPFLKLKTLRPHEIWPIHGDQVFVLLCVELK